jgi:hypothetical protein
MLPSRSARPLRRRVIIFNFLAVALLCASAIAQPKGGITPQSLPLPVGHEAKGIVLPDYDLEGRLRARFEAATAKRIDEERVQFTGLRMTTFNPETAAPDLAVEIPVSTLDLTTRVITSSERTTIARADLQIAGDRMEFDTATRQGRLVGNVKMVITGADELTRKRAE